MLIRSLSDQLADTTAKRKLANARREKSRTPEARERARLARLEKSRTPEARERARLARLERFSTPAGKTARKGYNDKAYARGKQLRLENIAILDMETDPFDAAGNTRVLPFLAVLYSDHFAPIVIWEDYPERRTHCRPWKRGKNPDGTPRKGTLTNAEWKKRCAHEEKEERAFKELERTAHKKFAASVREEIERLPGRYTIYAHNGGKFDFLFLLPEIRGPLSFKGRGIMRANIGAHELRDSFNIIPTSLKKANKKDEIDYALMSRDKRDAHRDEIVKYCIADCHYLLELVREFNTAYGFKISIGQAAMSELKKNYDVPTLTQRFDAYLRPYYHGGRVECLQGSGLFSGYYALYDVNSMYPAVMRNAQHPIGAGGDYIVRSAYPDINNKTAFVTLECDNLSALLGFDDDGTLTSFIKHGIFHTTIHEYRTAKRLGLISNVRLIKTLDCSSWTTFEKFVDPLYSQRAIWTRRIDAGEFPPLSAELSAAKRLCLFLKLIMNNAYGKFAQDPSKFKEFYATDTGQAPPPEAGEIKSVKDPDGWFAHHRNPDYWLWDRPANEFHGYYNVGTAASITGAARAVLMEAIHNSEDAIYCDTDSLLCRSLNNTEIDSSKLGAWKLEGQFTEAYIAGKKSYAFVRDDGTTKIRHKGGTLNLEQMKAMVLDGASVSSVNKGCTISRNGEQVYIERLAKATATSRS